MSLVLINAESMTKEIENPECDPGCQAATLAVSLVNQMLDDASVIASASRDSGLHWQNISRYKKLRSSRLSGPFYNEDMTSTTVSNGDTQHLNDNIENLLDNVVTSTPEQTSAQTRQIRNETINIIIGQGDEEFEETNATLQKSPSTIINHIFDMSEVEGVNVCDETYFIPANKSSDYNEFDIDTVKYIIDCFLNNAINILFGQEGQKDDSQSNYCESLDLTDKSSYSFLNDFADIPKDICLNIKDDVCDKKIDQEKSSTNEIESENTKNNNEAAFYENVYLTLNRDYEQCSEDDEPVLQDPKTMLMQEVELLTAHTSSENIEPCQVKEELESSAKPTSVASSRKSSLVHRCRIQGAKLLSCFRGWWWRRKMPGKRKVPRAPGSIRGFCPLSPDVRRRAASLLDQRQLRSPTPSTSLAWKFNTVNESLIHSSRWREFDLKTSLNENDEF